MYVRYKQSYGSAGVNLTKPLVEVEEGKSCNQAGREFHCGLMAKT